MVPGSPGFLCLHPDHASRHSPGSLLYPSRVFRMPPFHLPFSLSVYAVILPLLEDHHLAPMPSLSSTCRAHSVCNSLLPPVIVTHPNSCFPGLSLHTMPLDSLAPELHHARPAAISSHPAFPPTGPLTSALPATHPIGSHLKFVAPLLSNLPFTYQIFPSPDARSHLSNILPPSTHQLRST